MATKPPASDPYVYHPQAPADQIALAKRAKGWVSRATFCFVLALIFALFAGYAAYIFPAAQLWLYAVLAVVTIIMGALFYKFVLSSLRARISLANKGWMLFLPADHEPHTYYNEWLARPHTMSEANRRTFEVVLFEAVGIILDERSKMHAISQAIVDAVASDTGYMTCLEVCAQAQAGVERAFKALQK